jgi:hypothetical protein
MHPRLEASAKRERRGLVASESNGSHSCVSVSVFDTVGASSSSPITKDFELELSSSLLDSQAEQIRRIKILMVRSTAGLVL